MNGSGIESATCPACVADLVRPVVQQGDVLVLPELRRMVKQYSIDASGAAELHLYYGAKEVSFDELDLFPFGETLARQDRFTARDAIGWGESHEWSRIRDLLQQL